MTASRIYDPIFVKVDKIQNIYVIFCHILVPIFILFFHFGYLVFFHFHNIIFLNMAHLTIMKTFNVLLITFKRFIIIFGINVGNFIWWCLVKLLLLPLETYYYYYYYYYYFASNAFLPSSFANTLTIYIAKNFVRTRDFQTLPRMAVEPTFWLI